MTDETPPDDPDDNADTDSDGGLFGDDVGLFGGDVDVDEDSVDVDAADEGDDREEAPDGDSRQRGVDWNATAAALLAALATAGAWLRVATRRTTAAVRTTVHHTVAFARGAVAAARAQSGELRDHYDDLDPDVPWSMADSRRVGARVGDAVTGALNRTIANVLLLVTRFIPGSQRFWQGLLTASYRGLLRTSGGDAIMHIIDDGTIRHLPVKKKRDTDAPVDHPRWVSQGGDWWESGEGGQYVYLKGKTPVVFASAKSNELNDHIQAETATVIEHQGTEQLLTDAEITRQEIHVEPDPGQSADQAVADGGAELEQQTTYNTTVDGANVLEEIADLTVVDEAAGRLVNMANYYELYPSTPNPEKMDQQKIAGQLMEADPSADRAFVIKVLLIALGIIAVVYLGPPLIKALLGGGGGGGGGIVPIMLGGVAP